MSSSGDTMSTGQKSQSIKLKKTYLQVRVRVIYARAGMERIGRLGRGFVALGMFSSICGRCLTNKRQGLCIVSACCACP